MRADLVARVDDLAFMSASSRGLSAALNVMTARVAGSTFSSAWQHGQTTSNNPVPFVLAIPES